MAEQLSIFDGKKEHVTPPPPPGRPEAVNAESTLGDALKAYRNHLASSGYSHYTVDSFCSDVKLFKGYFGDRQVGVVATQDMKNFLAYLKQAKGEKPKTLYRRVTALKNFFGWLYREKILRENPAVFLVFRRAVPPLPEILTSDECDRYIEESKRNLRDYVLVLILLGAGPKRSELTSLTKDSIDVSDPRRPVVWIRSENRHRERKLPLPLDFVQAYNEHIEKYRSEGVLFDYTERNLKHILQAIAGRAGIKKKVSCQILRDTFAVQCIMAGEKIEDVFKKLGLTLTQETKAKYIRLAELIG